ncbi:PTS sugar transporter subunit IIA [Halanaerobium congolense]|jgi:PTS system glucose-specific IIA component|uniref:PTS system IIA component (Glc family) n=1 Tax=Halanaerobium congolense TaxID=54121 RepID=A0A1G6PZH2_9FIRM|nr:PTS glucose transporter subunit IIA [Halanaerobium congolense]OEG63341.1 MAG: PTS glucose transporter subunit IIA [Halanaerobium sp. MDAL1]PXV68300.1 PTS system IIA component (Glc family) [Halanaerobium congolense]SDC85513.1 PTS system, glucose-specific IIA component [Halanaerobium congolense]SDG90182.1 PTS system, glucose-specific IIA component [Halanaerobium congolense]SDK99144.1 PTS system, glucose-specific IIA component [Halanaerobium congolense]
MFNIFKKKEEYLTAPFAGEVTNLKQVPDEAFAQKMLGDGFAITPEENVIKSPCAGEIVQIFSTGHAVGIQTKKGLEVLVHIGIDTVKLDGEGFEKLVKNGDQVKVGTPLIEVDLEYIKNNAPSISTPVIITNMEKVKSMELVKTGKVKAGTKVLKVELA